MFTAPYNVIVPNEKVWVNVVSNKIRYSVDTTDNNVAIELPDHSDIDNADDAEIIIYDKTIANNRNVTTVIGSMKNAVPAVVANIDTVGSRLQLTGDQRANFKIGNALITRNCGGNDGKAIFISDVSFLGGDTYVTVNELVNSGVTEGSVALSSPVIVNGLYNWAYFTQSGNVRVMTAEKDYWVALNTATIGGGRVAGGLGEGGLR